MPFGGGAYTCVTTSPRSSSARMAGSGSADWPMWTISGSPNGFTACRARRSASTAFEPATFLETRTFTPAITSR